MRSCQKFLSNPEALNFGDILSPGILEGSSGKCVVLLFLGLLPLLEPLPFLHQAGQGILYAKGDIEVGHNRKALGFHVLLILQERVHEC